MRIQQRKLSGQKSMRRCLETNGKKGQGRKNDNCVLSCQWVKLDEPEIHQLI